MVMSSLEKNTSGNMKNELTYTKPEMVRYLLSKTPIEKTDSVLDAGSGKNKVWYNEVKVKEKYECEIEEGCDFYKWTKKVDWVIGNPPHRYKGKNQVWKWFQKASEIANKGMAFLLNHKVFNTLTPKRLQELADKGFYLQKIVIVSDTRWFGRYYYLIFQKKKSDFLEWNLRSF
jgi:hypothetical protein